MTWSPEKEILYLPESLGLQIPMSLVGNTSPKTNCSLPTSAAGSGSQDRNISPDPRCHYLCNCPRFFLVSWAGSGQNPQQMTAPKRALQQSRELTSRPSETILDSCECLLRESFNIEMVHLSGRYRRNTIYYIKYNIILPGTITCQAPLAPLLLQVKNCKDVQA